MAAFKRLLKDSYLRPLFLFFLFLSSFLLLRMDAMAGSSHVGARRDLG